MGLYKPVLRILACVGPPINFRNCSGVWLFFSLGLYFIYKNKTVLNINGIGMWPTYSTYTLL